MKNRNSEPRFDGQTEPSGALPRDLKDRLRRFRETSGLTWSALARSIDVDRRLVRRWRRGAVVPPGRIGGE